MNNNTRVKNNYAFIDGNNLYLGIKNQGWKLDYKKFRVWLKDKYNIEKVYLFLGYIPENQDLYTFLQENGYILIFKNVLRLPNNKVKGNVDAELVLYSMIEYENYDKAIIVSGDGDLNCLIDYLNKKDKLLRLIIPNRYKFSSFLRKFMPKIVFMNDLKEKLGFNKNLKGRHRRGTNPFG
jgi:uncharacterized LabA/DUF88 family protein